MQSNNKIINNMYNLLYDLNIRTNDSFIYNGLLVNLVLWRCSHIVGDIYRIF